MSCHLLDEFICFEQKFGQDALLRSVPIRTILRSDEHTAFPGLLSHALEMKRSVEGGWLQGAFTLGGNFFAFLVNFLLEQ